jgi:serine phosphatase RsbU (regulator of sigma subunit)
MPGVGYEEDEIVLKGGESVLFYSDGLAGGIILVV